MKISFFLALIIVCSSAAGQQADQLIFNETIHDFGTIDENAGNAVFEFSFTNNSGRPVNIVSVSASCGCTTPGWTKETIERGKTGFVKASFDPRGRPGYFNKTLTVNTNLNGPSIVLQIKGTVTNADMENDVSRFAIVNGSLRLRAREVNFGKVFINRPAIAQEIPLYNAGTRTIKIDSVKAPQYLKVEIPDSIGSQQKITMKVTYNAMLRNQYGFLADKIDLVTNDETAPRKSFPVFATVEEYFLPVSSEDADKIPVMTIESEGVDFGSFNMGSIVEKTIKIRNTGKKELALRYIQPNCPCITVKADKEKAKTGEEIKVTVAWKGDGKHGTQHKAITFYSSDPVHPVQRLSLLGNIQ
jgi:hypothetical protein